MKTSFTESGLSGASAVSILPGGSVWATFEQGGADGAGGIVVLDPNGARRALLDAATQPGASRIPGASATAALRTRIQLAS